MLRSVANRVNQIRAKKFSLEDLSPARRARQERYWERRDRRDRGLHKDSKGFSRAVWSMNPDFTERG